MHDPTSTTDQRRRFEQLVLPHLESAMNLARWIMSNHEDAKDIVQDATLRAFRSLDSLRGENARAWFLAIVRNACYTAFARSRSQREHEAFDDETAASSREVLPGWSGSPPDPLTSLERQSDLELVRRLIHSLPAEYREILVLREVEEFSYKSIAEIAGLPVGTVMSRLSRARALLESKLVNHFGSPGRK
jgi:RNA polymerase sigma-70 factor (ECF subfamily)